MNTGSYQRLHDTFERWHKRPGRWMHDSYQVGRAGVMVTFGIGRKNSATFDNPELAIAWMESELVRSAVPDAWPEEQYPPCAICGGPNDVGEICGYCAQVAGE